VLTNTSSTVIALCVVLATIGMATVGVHQWLPRKALTQIDAFRTAHPIQEGEPPISHRTALGGAYTVLVVCLALCFSISTVAQPNNSASSSLSPSTSGTSQQARTTLTISITTFGSTDCTQHISGFAPTSTAAATAGTETATCSFDLVCTDCTVEDRTFGFDAHWSVQQGKFWSRCRSRILPLNLLSAVRPA
jgi:hypothetical protein